MKPYIMDTVLASGANIFLTMTAVILGAIVTLSIINYRNTHHKRNA